MKWIYIVRFHNGTAARVNRARGFKHAMRIAIAHTQRCDVASVARHAPDQPFILAQRTVRGAR